MRKLEGSGRTIRHVLYTSFTQYRTKRESFWIKQLRTAYLYGSNVDLGDNMRKNSEGMFGRHFPSLNWTKCCQCKGIKHKLPNKISGKRFLHKLNYKLFNDLPNIINFHRVIIAALNKKSLKDVADILHDLILMRRRINACSGTWWSLIRYNIKLYRELSVRHKRKPPENFCKVYFSDKAFVIFSISFWSSIAFL